MGVKDLWSLLSVAGRRQSIESLSGQVLAIDASIWLTQFVRGMRDEDGGVVNEAHLLGSLRRILRLLHHDILPIFVFDGQVLQKKERILRKRQEGYDKNEEKRRMALRKLLISQIKKKIKDQKEHKEQNDQNDSNPSKKEPIFILPPSSSTSASSSSSSSSSNQVDLTSLDDIQWEEEVIDNDVYSEKYLSSSSSSSLSESELEIDEEMDDEELDAYLERRRLEKIKKKEEKKQLKKERKKNRRYRRDLLNFDDEEVDDYELPSNLDELNFNIIKNLPSNIKKNIILKLKRKLNKDFYVNNDIKSFNNYYLFSQIQLNNFLNLSKINEQLGLKYIGTEDKSKEGRRIASEGNKKYIYYNENGQAEERYRESSNENDNDEEDRSIGDEKKRKSENVENSDEIEKKRRKEEEDEGDIEYSDENLLYYINEMKKQRAEAMIVEEEERRLEEEDKKRYGEDEEVVEILSEDEELLLNNWTSTAEDKIVKISRGREKEVKLKNLRRGHYNPPENTDVEEIFVIEEKKVEMENQGIIENEKKQIIEISENQEEDLTNIAWEEEEEVEEEVDEVEEKEEAKDNEKNADSLQNFDNIEWENDSDYESEIVKHQQNRDKGGGMNFVVPISFLDKLKEDINIEEKKEGIKIEETKTAPPLLSSIYPVKKEETSHSSSTLPAIEVNEDLKFLDRAINTASSISDWAAHRTKIVFKHHLSALNSSSSTSSSSSVPPPIVREDDGLDILNKRLEEAEKEKEEEELRKRKEEELRKKEEELRKKEEEENKKKEEDERKKKEEEKKINEEKNFDEVCDLCDEEIEEILRLSEEKNEKNDISSLYLSSTTQQLLDELEGVNQDPDHYNELFNRSVRQGEMVTEDMKEEVMKMLRAFSLPYIIAPYEAEAQCAYLEQIGLVDGVVSEDSDCFLFGARKIYRRLFSEQEHVEAFYVDDIEQELGLSREDFIMLTFFLGSDYTEGVRGVGIVNAMEILEAFEKEKEGEQENLRIIEDSEEDGDDSEEDYEVSGGFFKDSNSTEEREKEKEITKKKRTIRRKDYDLQESKKLTDRISKRLLRFKEWLDGYNLAEDLISKFSKKVGEKKKKMKRRRKTKEEGDNEEEEEVEEEEEEEEINSLNEEEIKNLTESELKIYNFDRKHQNSRSKWKITPSFTDVSIISEFAYPSVNRELKAKDLHWPQPDLSTIRKFCSLFLQFTPSKMDTLIDPVIKKFAQRRKEEELSGESEEVKKRKRRRAGRDLQTKITSHFYIKYDDNLKISAIQSDRLRKTVKQLSGKKLDLNVGPSNYQKRKK